MVGSDKNGCVQRGAAETPTPTQRIAQLNDELRRHGRGGRWLITAGIAALDPERVQAIVLAVRTFNAFSDDNNPHGERDFGALTVMAQRLLWKIDYYDISMEFGSPDPSDPNVTTRLLTVMLAQEY